MADPSRPSIEDAAGTVDDAFPVTLRARVGGPSPVTPRILGIGALLVAILVVKPWGGGLATPQAPESAGSSRAPVLTATGELPTAAPQSQAEVIADQCRAPSGWRILMVARWHNETVHIWSAVKPVATADPGDPEIPYLSVIADEIPALGYCAPLFGPERPAGRSAADLWRIAADGRPESIHPPRLEPPFETSLVGLYAPPAATSPGGSKTWPSGRYLFNANGLWFGIDLRIARTATRPTAAFGS